MKKKFKFLFILMFVVYSFTLAACDFNKIFSFLPWVTEEKVEYYIDFMVDDEYYDTIKIEEGSSFYLPENPYKEGYEFIGWVYSNGEEFNIHDVIDGDMTLYAEFREKTSNNETITIYFYVDDELFETKEMEKGHIHSFTVPYKEGMEFDYWVLKDGTKFNLDSYIKEDLHLYAVFKESDDYKVSYYIGDLFIESQTYKYREKIDLIDIPECGHKFLGWYTYYDSLIYEGYSITDSLSLHAKFEGIDDSYTYHEFYLNDKLIEANWQKKNEKLEFPEFTIPEGSFLGGWKYYINVNSSTGEPYYTYFFNNNYNELNNHSSGVYYADIVKYNESFEYETYNNRATITRYNGNSEVVEIPTEIDGNVVTNVSDRTFVFSPNVKKVVIPKDIEHFNDFTYYSNASVYYKGSRGDYIKHSYYPTLGSNKIYYYSEDNSEYRPSFNTNYWRYVNGIPTPWATECNVTFMVDNEVFDVYKITAGHILDYNNTPRKDNHEFIGWYNDDGTEFIIGSDRITVDKTLYAKFEEIKEEYITVTYFVDLKLDKTQEFIKGSYFENYYHPTKEGYTFDGWYDMDGNKYDVNSILNKNVTLYAKFEEKAVEYITVTYFVDSKVEKTEQIILSGSITNPYTPYKEGYKFLYWTDIHGNAVNLSDKFYSDLYLYAKFEEIKDEYVTVTYFVDLKLDKTQEFIKGSFFENYYQPTMEGYNFVCWKDMDGNIYDESVILANNVTLYAVLEESVTEYNGFTYSEFDDHIEILKYIGQDTDIIIPEKINNKNVTVIYNDAFIWGSLTSIVIPKTITTINDGAFYQCYDLKSVYYGGNIEQWNEIEIIFNNDSLLNATRYYYSETEPTTTGNYWHYVDGKPEIWPNVLSYNVNFYVDGSLYHTDHVIHAGKLNLPVNPTKEGYKFVGWYYEEYGFMWDSSLYTVIYDMTLTAVFEEIIFESTLFTYNEFEDYIEITGYTGNDKEICIPNLINGKPVKVIGKYSLFSTNFTSVTIGDNVERIENGAFESNKIETLYIGKNVNYIASDAFYHSTNLHTVIVDSNNKVYDSRDNCNAIIETATNTLVKGTAYSIIPNTVTTIGRCAYGYIAEDFSCTDKYIILPLSIRAIQENAFACKGIDIIYYCGNVNDWKNIIVEDEVLEPVIYYYSETEPTTEGNFWHYVDGKPVVLEKDYNTLYLDSYSFENPVKLNQDENGNKYIKTYLDIETEFIIRNIDNSVTYGEVELDYHEAVERWMPNVRTLVEGVYYIEITYDGYFNVYLLKQFNSFEVKYIVNDEVYEIRYTDEPSLFPANPYPDGQLFIGWEYNGEFFDPNTRIVSDITLTAKLVDIYEEQNYHLVTLWNDYDLYYSRRYKDGSKIELPTAPVKQGYRFIGWYDGIYKCNENTIINSSLSLVAKYENITEEEIYTINYMVDDESYHSMSSNRYYYSLNPVDPVKENYEFIGWFYNDVKWINDKAISQNITLEAKFKELSDFEYNEYDDYIEITKYIQTDEICVEIPDTYKDKPITHIASNAFYEYSNLETVIFGKNIKYIGENAFYNDSDEVLYFLYYQGTLDDWFSIQFEDNFIQTFGIISVLDNNGNSIYLKNSPDISIQTLKFPNIDTPLYMNCLTGIDSTGIIIPADISEINMKNYTGSNITNIYIEGSKEEFNPNLICDLLGPMYLESLYYFYSETTPTTEGKFWHYVDGNPVIWENTLGTLTFIVNDSIYATKEIILGNSVLIDVNPTIDGYVVEWWYDDFGNQYSLNIEYVFEESIVLTASLYRYKYNIDYIFDYEDVENNNPNSFNVGEEFDLEEAYLFDYVFEGWYLDKEFTMSYNHIGNDILDITLYGKFSRSVYSYNENEDYIEITGLNEDYTALSMPNEIHGKPVTKIARNAFLDEYIMYVKFPNQLTYIGEDAFNVSGGLFAVEVESLSQWFNIEFENLYANPLSFEGVEISVNNEKVENIVVPDEITKINNYAFARYNIRSIDFNNVVEIGEYSFYDANFHLAYNILDLRNVTKIGYYAFEDTNIEYVNPYMGSYMINYDNAAFDEEIFKGFVVSDDAEHCYLEYFYYTKYDIFYEGSKELWLSNVVNGGPIAERVYYLSEEEPKTTGNFWHYIDKKPAIWPEVLLYNVNFYVDGSLYHTEHVIHEGKLNLPVNPTKEGYNFIGWYYEEYGFMWDSSLYTVIYDMTLTAVFEKEVTDLYIYEFPQNQINNNLKFDINLDGTYSLIVDFEREKSFYITNLDGSISYRGYELLTKEGAEDWGPTIGITVSGTFKIEVKDGKVNVYLLEEKVFEYNEYDNYVEITKYVGTDEVVEIPSEINGKPVTHIASNILLAVTSVFPIKVIIPNSVQHISKGALSASPYLEELVIPFIGDTRENTTLSLGYIFDNTSNTNLYNTINKVTITDMETIPSGALSNCPIQTIEFGAGVKVLGQYSCDHSSMKNLVISDSIERIEAGAFAVNGIESIFIGKNVKYIASNAFIDSTRLTTIVVDEDNTFFNSREGSNAIIETSTNKVIKGVPNSIIPEGVTTIGEDAFAFIGYNHEVISNGYVVLPSTITKIENNAFSNSGLTDIYYSNSKSSWEYGVSGIENILNLNINYSPSWRIVNGTPVLNIYNDNAYYYIEDNKAYFYGICNTVDFTMPTQINGYPLVQFDENSFWYHVNATVYYKGTEEEWNNINRLDNPWRVYFYIDTNINYPSQYGQYWHYVDGKPEVVFKEDTNYAYWIIPGIECVELGLYTGTEENVIIPNSFEGKFVYSIYTGTFKDNEYIKSIRINGQLRTKAIDNCPNLEYLIISDMCVMFDENSVINCNNFKTVYYEKTQKDWNETFQYSNTLWLEGCDIYYYSKEQPTTSGNYWHYVDGKPVVWTEINPFKYNEYDEYVEITGYIGNEVVVEIPDEINGKPVISIADNAFENCSQIECIYMSDYVETIGTAAFISCTSLREIYLSNSLKSIGNYAFIWCTSLTNLTIPNNIGYLPKEFVCGCSSLEYIVIPSTVKYMELYVFDGCNSLKNIYFEGYLHEWHEINVDEARIPLSTVVNFYSETEPTEEGNYWHYVDGKPAIWPIYSPFEYIEFDTYIIITKYNGVDKDVVVPRMINNKPVEVIDSCAFEFITLNSIVIPDTVRVIGTKSFDSSNIGAMYFEHGKEEWDEKFANSIDLWCMLPTTIYTYLESQPLTTDDDYWHYVNDVPVVW